MKVFFVLIGQDKTIANFRSRPLFQATNGQETTNKQKIMKDMKSQLSVVAEMEGMQQAVTC